MDMQDLVNHPIVSRVSQALQYSFHKCVVTGSVAFGLQYSSMDLLTDESDIDILLLPVVHNATNGGIVTRVKEAILAARWHYAETSRGTTIILTAIDPTNAYREVSFELRSPRSTRSGYGYSDIGHRAMQIGPRLYLLSADDLYMYYTALGRDKDKLKVQIMDRFKQLAADSARLLID